MSKSDEAIREFAEKWAQEWNEITGWHKSQTMYDYMLSDLTALISEHYYPKEKYDELLQQRDELREALINVMAIIKDCYPLLFDNEKPAVKQAEAAIKNTEPKAEECSYWKTDGCCLPGCGTDSCEHHPLNR